MSTLALVVLTDSHTASEADDAPASGLWPNNGKIIMAAAIVIIATVATSMSAMFMAARKMFKNARSGRILSDITK